MPAFTLRNIPPQHGRVAVVTGANSGIGYEGALGPARVGARVVLACRTRAKAEQAAVRIRAVLEHAAVEPEPLDRSSPSNRGGKPRLS